MPINPPFDDGRWPNPWPPQISPAGGTWDWTDPFIHLPASAPNPFASAPAPFTAAHLGAMAWHPPIFSDDWPTFVPNNFSATAWPPQPFLPVARTPTLGLSTPPGWSDPQPFLSSPAQLASPPAPGSIDNPPGLFARDPSVSAGGPFPYLPEPAADPTSPFGSGLFSADGVAGSMPFPGVPNSASALGWPASQSLFAPPAPVQSPSIARDAPFDPSGSPPSGSTYTPPAAAPPTRSVLFNQSATTWDLGAFDRALANLGQSGQTLGLSDLPLSKSGTPFIPPPPQLSFTPQIGPLDWLDVAHFLSPNLVDYFTKTPPLPPPFPATPGKIPSTDNPYAAPAVLEALNWLVALLPGGEAVPLIGATRLLEDAAAAAALRAARTAGGALGLTRAGERIAAVPYGKIRGTLPPGFQANHLNQSTVYEGFIPKDEGLSVPMRGNIITEPGTPHHIYHRSLEQFWDQYRRGGSLESARPTNAEYGEAVRRALIASGFSRRQASDLAAQAAAQRVAAKLSESAPVPLIPKAIWRTRR
jgi:hypothetical protein